MNFLRAFCIFTDFTEQMLYTQKIAQNVGLEILVTILLRVKQKTNTSSKDELDRRLSNSRCLLEVPFKTIRASCATTV